MKERERKQLSSLEKKHKMGRWKYTAVYGGGFMLALFLFRIGSDYFYNESSSDIISINNILKELVSTSIGGLIFGLLTWYFNESNYKSLLKKQANESNS